MEDGLGFFGFCLEKDKLWPSVGEHLQNTLHTNMLDRVRGV